MLTREENDLITRTNPGTPLGDMMRRFWIPAFMASEIRENDGAPIRTAPIAAHRWPSVATRTVA